MRKDELETIIRKVAGEDTGVGRRFAEKIGTTGATVSRWREGVQDVNARDVKLLRLIWFLTHKNVRWEDIADRPVVSELEDIL